MVDIKEPPSRMPVQSNGRMPLGWLEFFGNLFTTLSNLTVSTVVAVDTDKNLTAVTDWTNFLSGTAGQIQITAAGVFSLLVTGTDGEVAISAGGVLSLDPDYADVYVTGNAAATTLTTQNTWYQFQGFDTNGEYNGATPDHTNDHITVAKTGIYQVSVGFSFSGSASSTFQLQVKKNNGATSFNNLISERALGAAGDIGAGPIGPGLVSLTANDTIELWVRCITGASKSVTIKHCVLALKLIKTA